MTERRGGDMAKPRRKCRLADSRHRDVDLRDFRQEIIDTINKTVPGKHPEVFQSYFSTDPLTQSEAVAIGRALAKIERLKCYGKTVTTFRLFDGKTCADENSNTPAGASGNKQQTRPKGGRVQ